jgi:EAL domain-containing protein (putative c-di-GMP-specific phosphodiesterase class I)/CheY-like chemotaxis protein
MVSTAMSGEQALDILRTEHFDVIVTDLEMPGLDGFALIRAFSELDFDPGVILLSQHDPRVLHSARELALAYSVNVLGTLTKPIDRDQLFSALNEVADTRSSGEKGTETVLAESEFMRGLMTDGLAPVYQPKMDLKAGRIIGAEVYARWRAPAGGFLGAGAVIKVAREKGYMDVLTYRMLELAMQQQGKWRKEGQNVALSINVASENLRKPDFADVVSGLADQFEIDPSMVRLEVTESDLDVDTRVPLEVLSRLHMRGFGLALDDFGTGFASLLRLKKIPFDELVIDRQFVARAHDTETARVILETAIELSHKLKLVCTCEGVETEEQLKVVKDLGADFAQGYLFGKPMSADEFLIWVEDFKDGVLEVPGMKKA